MTRAGLSNIYLTIVKEGVETVSGFLLINYERSPFFKQQMFDYSILGFASTETAFY